MDLSPTNKKTINRRRAFRIYEQADLFYHKIETSQENDVELNFNHIIDRAVPSSSTNSISSEEPSFEQSLPDSNSGENDTLNVNISSTGISFTSKEELVPGDYIVIRVLLLSSMTVIMTCCKVVYIKPSNPFEKEQYPHTIGASFVNLKQEDEELLKKHISKRRTRRLIVNGLIFAFFITVIQVPDLVFELLTGLLSFLLDEIIELTHLLHELFEYSLDLIVEHTFHTDPRSTQSIVFYTQVIFAIAISYPLSRTILSVCKNSFNGCCLFCSRKKSSLFYRWGQQTLLYKLGMITLGITTITFFSLFLI